MMRRVLNTTLKRSVQYKKCEFIHMKQRTMLLRFASKDSHQEKEEPDTTTQIEKLNEMTLEQFKNLDPLQKRKVSADPFQLKRIALQSLFEEKDKRGELYFGVHIPDDAPLELMKLESEMQDFVEQFFIDTELLPRELSRSYSSLYIRMSKARDYIYHVHWATDLAKPKGFEMYDEWQATSKQFNKLKGSMSPKDLKILEPLYNQTDLTWKAVMSAEQIFSSLKNLTHKYMNVYTFPREDFEYLCMLIDEYIKLNDTLKDDILKKKIIPVLHQSIVYLKQKIILPELSMKYPTIFK
jgi:hypothetical protein